MYLNDVAATIRPETGMPLARLPLTQPTHGRLAWSSMRRDLLAWIVLSDLVAITAPAWIALPFGGAGATLAATTVGLLIVVGTWGLGGLGAAVVDHGSVPLPTLLGLNLLALPVSLLAHRALGSSLGPIAVGCLLTAQFLLILIGRVIESGHLRRRRMDGHALRRTLIVMGPGAEPMLHEMRRHPADGFLVIGYLSSGVPGSLRNAMAVPDAEGLAQMVSEEMIDVVMTLGAVAPDDLRSLMRGLEGTHVRLIVAPGLQDVVPGRLMGLPVTHGWTALIGVKTRRTREAGKKAVDRVVGLALLLAASPIIGIAALAVRLESPGSPFYSQTRVGLNGTHFTMWKLRSMYADADARRAALIARGGDSGNQVLFKDSRDPRITRVGRILRRTSLDELPQLINVVRGEMSLVGPRPALPSEVAQYDDEARRRLLVRPGMTGLWQVSGRSDLSWSSTVALDRHYVENRGALIDAKILAATARAVTGGKGAY